MPGPGPILILKLQNSSRDMRVPVVPLLAAGAAQSVADVEVGEKFLAADGAESVDELSVPQLRLDGGDLRSVRLAILRRCGSIAPAPARSDTAERRRAEVAAAIARTRRRAASHRQALFRVILRRAMPPPSR